MMQRSVSTANLVAFLGTGPIAMLRAGPSYLSQPILSNGNGRRDSAAAHCSSLLCLRQKCARQPRAQAFVLEPYNSRTGDVVLQPSMLGLVGSACSEAVARPLRGRYRA